MQNLNAGIWKQLYQVCVELSATRWSHSSSTNIDILKVRDPPSHKIKSYAKVQFDADGVTKQLNLFNKDTNTYMEEGKAWRWL